MRRIRQPKEFTLQHSKTGAKVGFAIAAAAVVALAAAVAFGDSGGPDADRVAGPGPDGGTVSDGSGPAAPDMTFELLDGGAASFADYQGRPVVVNFFADWCPACVAELPDLQAVHEEFAEDVVFLGLDRSTSDAALRALLAETGVSYDIALDRDGALFQAFGGFAMPTTVFIDASGEIVDRQNGVIFEDDLRERLTGILGTT